MDASTFFYVSSFEIIGKFAKSVIGQYVIFSTISILMKLSSNYK